MAIISLVLVVLVVLVVLLSLLTTTLRRILGAPLQKMLQIGDCQHLTAFAVVLEH